MYKYSRYLKHISYAVSLLALSALSISCSPEEANTNGSLSNSSGASSNSICSNAFVPELPYSKAESYDSYENYQLVFVRGGAFVDDLLKLANEASEQAVRAAKHNKNIPIDDILQATRQSGVIDDVPTIARARLRQTSIPVDYYIPLINYAQQQKKALTVMSMNDAMSVIPNYRTQQDLEVYLEPIVRQRISSIQVPTNNSEVNETVNFILNAQANQIARQASRIAISLYCK